MAPQQDDSEKTLSVVAVQVLSFVVINFLLWGVAASIYNGGATSRRTTGGNLAVFVSTSVATLPEFPSVVSYIWEKHKWYVAVAAVVEMLLIGFVLWIKKVDEDLKRGSPFRRR